jgi:hypothetical protein
MILPSIGVLGTMILPSIGVLGTMVLPSIGVLGTMILPSIGVRDNDTPINRCVRDNDFFSFYDCSVECFGILDNEIFFVFYFIIAHPTYTCTVIVTFCALCMCL